MHYYYMRQHGRTFNAEQKKPDTKSKHSIMPLHVGFSLGNGHKL